MDSVSLRLAADIPRVCTPVAVDQVPHQVRKVLVDRGLITYSFETPNTPGVIQPAGEALLAAAGEFHAANPGYHSLIGRTIAIVDKHPGSTSMEIVFTDGTGLWLSTDGEPLTAQHSTSFQDGDIPIWKS